MKRIISILMLLLIVIMTALGCNKAKKITSENEYDTNMWPKGIADICRNETGYYVATENFLYTIENETAMPLCNKADCSHTDKNCNAYLSYIQAQSVWYDGSKLYVVAGDEMRGSYSMYEIATDGSGSKKICALFQANGAKSISTSCYYKDGYVYYALDLQTMSDINRGIYSQKLYRLKLESGADPELIFENEDRSVSTVLGRCYFYQDDMYVVVCTRTSSGNGNTSVLYRYSTKTGEMEPFLDRFVSYYFVAEDMLYYTTSDGIYRYDLNENTESLFYEKPEFCSDMYFDGNYIYLEDSWYQAMQEEHTDKINIYILNLEGELCKTLSLDWGTDIFYGDGEQLVVKNMYSSQNGSPYGRIKYSFYDKAQIGTGGEEWTSVELENRLADGQ